MARKKNPSEFIVKCSSRFTCGLLCLVFLFLSLASMLLTNVFDPKNFIREHILFVPDNVLLNIAIIAAVIFLLALLKRFSKYIHLKAATIALIAYTTFIGIVWIVSVQSVPAADSGIVINAAKSFVRGDYSSLLSTDSYFRFYPFQLGFTYICELLMRIFGTENYIAMEIVNLLFVDTVFIALLQLTRLVFDNEKIGLLTILLLAGCLQPILLCTFIYGNIMGLAFSLWAVVFEMLYIKTGKKYMILLAALLIAFAIIAKLNYSIVLIAMCMILLLHCIKTHKLFSLLSIVCAAAISLGMFNLVIMGYEARAGAKLGSGVPQTAWLAMGMQESYKAEGWYNGYSKTIFDDNHFDSQAAARQIQKDISSRLNVFKEKPAYALTFYAKKAISEWNEPTYQSIWISQVKEHISPVPRYVNSVYQGTLGSFLGFYFNSYQ